MEPKISLQNHVWSRIYKEQLSSTPSPRWWRPAPMFPRSASRRRRPASRPPAGSPGAGPPGHTCDPPAGRWCCAAGRGSEPPPASCGRSGRSGGLWCRRAEARPPSYGSKPAWSTWTERHDRLWRTVWSLTICHNFTAFWLISNWKHNGWWKCDSNLCHIYKVKQHICVRRQLTLAFSNFLANITVRLCYTIWWESQKVVHLFSNIDTHLFKLDVKRTGCNQTVGSG